MRSGYLHTTKLAEAVQGVPTVYERYGDVKTSKVSVVLLIDQSGSMMGGAIESARRTAILFKESLKKVQDVSLFIYGHSGDITSGHSTDLFIFQEPGYDKQYSLGNCEAISQNRDGTAIREIVKRVRKFTKNPIVFFMIADGIPAASGYGGSSGMADVRHAVKFAESKGVQVINISIDSSYDPSSMYKHYFKFTTLSEVPRQIGNLMRKVVSKAIEKTTTFR